MKKKVLAAVLSGAMIAAALTGCGGNTDSTPADTKTDAADSGTENQAAADGAENADTAQASQEEAADDGAEDTGSIVSAPTELTFIFADGDEGAKAAMNEIVNKFNETYPDITLLPALANVLETSIDLLGFSAPERM